MPKPEVVEIDCKFDKKANNSYLYVVDIHTE